MIKDILLKAAEDVQSGMWCRETWFEGHNMDEEWEISANPAVVFQAISVVQMAQSKRCAEVRLFTPLAFWAEPQRRLGWRWMLRRVGAAKRIYSPSTTILAMTRSRRARR